MSPSSTRVVSVCPCLAKGGANDGLATAPAEKQGGPRTRAHRTRASSPGPRLGSECGASNWPPAQPQYCHLCARPCKSPEDCPPPRPPSGESLCQPWNGGVGPGPSTSAAPSPHPGQISSSGCGPYLTPVPSQLQPAPPSRFLHIAGMCVRRPVASSLCFAAVRLPASGSGSGSPGCFLTLRRKASELRKPNGDARPLPPTRG